MTHWEIDYGNLRHIDYARLVREHSDEHVTYGFHGNRVPEYTVLRLGTDPDAMRICGDDSLRIMAESNAMVMRDEFDAHGLPYDLETVAGELAVKLYVNDDPRRGFTEGAVVALDLLDRMSDYPLLDDMDHSEREHEIAQESMDEALSSVLRSAETEETEDAVAAEFWETVPLDDTMWDWGLDGVWGRAESLAEEILERHQAETVGA